MVKDFLWEINNNNMVGEDVQLGSILGLGECLLGQDVRLGRISDSEKCWDGPPNLFNLCFCKLKPHVTLQNTKTTHYGRKVTLFERKNERKEGCRPEWPMCSSCNGQTILMYPRSC